MSRKINDNLKLLRGLLLENGGLKQTVFKNTFWLTLGTGLSRVLNFVLMVYVARILGATEYGMFAFAMAFVSLFTVVADLGIATILVRKFSQNKENEKEFHALISLKMVLGILMIAFSIVGAFFITHDPNIQKIIFILAFATLANSLIDTMYAFFQARQKMEHQASAAILGALLLTAFGFLVVLNFPSAENLSYAFLAANTITIVFILMFFHFKVYPIKLSWQKNIWRKYLVVSWPLAFTSFFGLLYTYIDSVMLGAYGMITENGFYTAAYRIAWMAYIFTGLAVTSFYPILSQSLGESKERFQQIWDYQMELMAVLAVPMMIGGIILAPKIIDLFYGVEFLPSVLALQILIVMAGILLLYAAFNQVLIVANQQKKLIFATLFGAVANIVLNFILIPKYSLYGAAAASALTQLLLFFLLAVFAVKFTAVKFPNLGFLKFFAKVMVAGIVMSYVLSRPQIFNLNIFLAMALGIMAYGISILILQFGKSIKNQFALRLSII